MHSKLNDLLIGISKRNMPNLWNKIDERINLEIKNKTNYKLKRKILYIASIGIFLSIGNIMRINIEKINNVQHENEYNLSEYDTLSDLNLESILENRILVDEFKTSYSKPEKNYMDLIEGADSIVYGKVIDVKGDVNSNGFIKSDLLINVISDYKDKIDADTEISVSSNGGEVTYYEYISKVKDEIIKKHGYDEVEDKGMNFISLYNNVPQYRIGEYVLIYIKKINQNDFSGRKEDETIEIPKSDYIEILKLYVDPNTKAVYRYKNDSELIKEKITTLNFFDNIK